MPPTILRPLLLAALTLGTAALACTDRTLGDDTDAPAATTAAEGATTAAPPDATTSAPQPTTAPPDPTTGADATSTSTTGVDDGSTTDPTAPGFLGPQDFPDNKECDQWAQDCPEGQKCAAVSLDGDTSWESLSCVPVVRDPAGPGEPCENLGTGLDGLDTCAKGHMCWDVDPDTGLGVCLAQCIGSPERPLCADPNATCSLTADGVLTFCFPNCDPLLQDCPGDDLCIYNPQDGGQTFLCAFDASGEEGQTFDPCEYTNVCDKGLLCLNPALASECDPNIQGCCLPFCDLSAPLDCPGAGQQCLPWYEEGTAPPEYENVGVCGLPQ